MLKFSKPLYLAQDVCVFFIMTTSFSPLFCPPPSLFCPGSLVAFVHNILSLSQHHKDLVGRQTQEILQARKSIPSLWHLSCWGGEAMTFFMCVLHWKQMIKKPAWREFSTPTSKSPLPFLFPLPSLPLLSLFTWVFLYPKRGLLNLLTYVTLSSTGPANM